VGAADVPSIDAAKETLAWRECVQMAP